MTDSFPYDVGYVAHVGGSTTCAQRSSRFNLHPSDIQLNLYVVYTILVTAPCAHQLLQYYYTCNDDLQPFSNCQYLPATFIS